MTILEAQPQLMQFPAKLRSIPQWVTWKLKPRAGTGEWTKPPYRGDGSNRMASVIDPATWTTFEQATAQPSYLYAGVGFVLREENGLVFIDLDHCIQQGRLADWAAQIVKEYQTYWELSPSRSGLHAWAKATLPGPGNKVGSVEMYATKRYATVTGLSLGHSHD
jgi:putative DNA primase/helicase